MRLENGPQHAHSGVLEGHLLMVGFELDRIELDGPALGLGSSGLQLNQNVLHRVTGKILACIFGRWEPGDVTGLVVDDVCEVHGDGVGMLLLGRFFVGSLFHAQNPHPGVIDFDSGLRHRASRSHQDGQT